MNKENICCVIITYNIGDCFYDCYNAIKNQVDLVIIVDNGSNQETINVLNDIKKDNKTQVVFNYKNYGIAKALNIGIKKAISNGYSWILTMDNDSRADKQMVRSMIDTYKSIDKNEREKIVSLSPVFFDRNYSERVKKSENNNCYSYKNLVITSGNLVKSEIFKEIGFFNEEYFIDYVDFEFCLRILENEKKIIEVNNAILNHKLGDGKEYKILNRVIKSSNHSALRRYYITRNSLNVYKKYKYMELDDLEGIKKELVKMTLKIILFETDKINKLMYILKGAYDYKRSKFGTYEER